ncbi:MAG TPA: AAA family ATPase [Phycisphaerae bacterium]|nr:AAA family ATPase [Phycisphaerae bacterium]
MTLGLVVGKFYPPHRGHKLLIDTARRQVDRLVVLLPAHPSQAIPGALRRQWLEEIHPDCEIHLVPDELDNDSRQWADFTLAHLGRAPDVVFSSEDYGPHYASFMGARHVMVDIARAQVPCSATGIRAAPLEHFHFLEPCVRAYYVRRVVLIGAESTGKTTLAAALAAKYQTAWVPEYGRQYWEKKVAGLHMHGPLPGWTDEEFLHIACEQQRRENRAARAANKVLLCDTNAFATGMWYERYMGRRHPDVDAVGARDTAHLYLLALPDFPFVQDGFRDGEKIRGWMHERFVAAVAHTGVPWVSLGGTHETRLAQAAHAIDALISTSPRGLASGHHG